VRTRRTDVLLSGRTGQGASVQFLLLLDRALQFCNASWPQHCTVQLSKVRCTGAAGGVHLVFWGSIDSTIDGKVDVTLGLPTDTLQRLGLRAPRGHVLPIAIGGTIDGYRVDWTT
jgi:hypothetical protein